MKAVEPGQTWRHKNPISLEVRTYVVEQVGIPRQGKPSNGSRDVIDGPNMVRLLRTDDGSNAEAMVSLRWM